MSPDQGYFKFGDDVICWGHSGSGTRQIQADLSLYDTLAEIQIDDGRLVLPFNANEIIDNLRLERYTGRRHRRQLLRRLYYLIRPYTNRAVRKEIQRLSLGKWQALTFPHWPVDTTVEDLSESLLRLSMQAQGIAHVPFIWFWPEGARGCVTMTHDVETAAGLDRCTELMDLDDAGDIKAAFQIVPEKRYPVSPTLLQSIRDRGFEVGVQDLNHDGGLFNSHQEFVRRATAINRYGKEYGAKGFRAGVLYRRPEWYDALEFSYDMSIPNVAHLDPQRGGCCTIMPYFIGKLLEIPVTTTQDYSLFHLLRQRSIDLWQTQTELILGRNGLVSFIVHPDYLANAELKAMYVKLLEYLQRVRQRENIWMALPGEIDRWWRARSRMSIVSDGQCFRIEGEGSERAQLAFARKVNGRLVYEIASSSANC